MILSENGWNLLEANCCNDKVEVKKIKMQFHGLFMFYFHTLLRIIQFSSILKGNLQIVY